jgi:hypothetical protein
MFSWGNSYWTQVYFTWVYLPLVVTGYLFGTILDIYIILDRITAFNKKFGVFFKFTPRIMMAIALALSIVIQLPWFFDLAPVSVTVTLDTGVDYQIWFSGLTRYAVSEVGQIVLFVVYATRDVGSMAVEIVLNIVSIVYFKLYVNRKKRLVTNSGASTIHRVQSVAVQPSRVSGIQSRKAKKGEVSRSDQKATVMCIVMCAVSIMEHVVHIMCNVYPYTPYFQQRVLLFLSWMASMGFVVKHGLNFVLFIAFNNKFQKIFLKFCHFENS